ncbi:v-SNARE, coiled-coil homology domain [Dillenia turbinata]|uniref:V-SNARE, coiled-coil homology domain n=1 Tax=Dillenia turbinata TaxID=194707 RepID=A0AAN8YYM5_9MAGN
MEEERMGRETVLRIRIEWALGEAISGGGGGERERRENGFAQDFRTAGAKIRRKMWLQNMKMKLIVVGIVIALILLIILSVCRGFNCGK